MSAPSANGPGLLGKIPAQGDFVRVGATSPLAQAFHRWLEEAHEGVRRANAQLPATPIRFLFTAPGEREVLIGTMAPGEDKVGRAFPLCVFRALDGAAAAEKLAELPLAFAPFFQSAEALIAEAAALRADDLGPRLAALEPQSRGDFALAGSERRLRAAASAGAQLSALASPEVPGNVYYGLRTFVLACRAEQKKEPSKLAGARARAPPVADVAAGVPVDARAGAAPVVRGHAVAGRAPARGGAGQGEHEAVAAADAAAERRREREAGAHAGAARRDRGGADDGGRAREAAVGLRGPDAGG
jgi:type VI secretion system ImpM family protein